MSKRLYNKLSDCIVLISKCQELCDNYNIPLSEFGLAHIPRDIDTSTMTDDYGDIKQLEYCIKHYTELYKQLCDIVKFKEIVDK